MASFLRPRRGKKATAVAQLTASAPLKRGEVFFEVPDTGCGTGTGKIKMGDGATAYASLPYFLEQPTVDYTNAVVGWTNTTAADSNPYTTNATYASNIVPSASLKTIFTNLKKLLLNYNSQLTTLNNDLENISLASGDLSSLTKKVNTNSDDISSLKTKVDTNTKNISTNTSSITTNKNNISTNTKNISTNTTNITTNKNNISTNTKNISTNTSNITTNKNNISSLTTKVDDNFSKLFIDRNFEASISNSTSQLIDASFTYTKISNYEPFMIRNIIINNQAAALNLIMFYFGSDSKVHIVLNNHNSVSITTKISVTVVYKYNF